MKKLIAGILLPLLLSCGREIPQDRLLSGNRTLKDIAAVVETSASGSMNRADGARLCSGFFQKDLISNEHSLQTR